MTTEFPEYHKINGVYKRHTEGPDKGRFIIGEYAMPEFEYLADTPWRWTEKIDGTNCRIQAHVEDDASVTSRIGGRTDNAQLHVELTAVLNDIADRLRLWILDQEDIHPGYTITLYGEGYGAGIQKGGHYRADKSFILFDVKIGDFWLSRQSVIEIAVDLGIGAVPGGFDMSLSDCITFVSMGTARSYMGEGAEIEGFVGTPTVPLFTRRGQRIITKVKLKDFLG